MNFAEETLGEICDRVGGMIRTGPFGSQLHASDYVPDGIPVVMPKNIADGRVSTEDIAKVHPEDVLRLSQHVLHKGDIVYGRRGDIGRHALITRREEGWLCGTGCMRVSLGDQVVYPEYLHYYLNQQSVTTWIANQAVGATMPNLNTDILRSVPVRYPHQAIQRRIVSILSAYDDLIENNLRRVAILEEMAQAIYREWFVEFRYPGHDRAALVQSELGEIPEDWRICRLSEVASVNELTTKQVDLPSSIVYVDISSVSLGRIGYDRLISREEIPSRARRVARHGDTIWSSVRPNRGSYGLVLDPPANLVVSTGFAVITPKRVPFSYLYHAVTADDFIGYLANHATGSAYPAVSFKDFEEACLPVPSVRLLDAFHTLTGDMLNGVNMLQRQNVALRQMRDLLIPKLVAGEVDLESLDGVCEKWNEQALPPHSGGLW